MTSDPDDQLLEGLQPAGQGSGPLLQRDYWAVVKGCRLEPVRLMEEVARRFCEIAPPELVTFRRCDEKRCEALAPADELDVQIAVAGGCRVRVVEVAPQTLTLATLEGHPEAGRITFGAYRNDREDVLFHIRSRARSGSGSHYLGFLTAGEAMQTSTWTDFVQAVARTWGDGVIGFVHVETHEIADADLDAMPQPDEPPAPRAGRGAIDEPAGGSAATFFAVGN